MRLVGVVLALGLAQAAYAQPPAVPAEVQAVIYELAQAYGLTPFGEAMLRELEDENRRLKKMYAEERLKAEIIQEAMAKKW